MKNWHVLSALQHLSAREGSSPLTIGMAVWGRQYSHALGARLVKRMKGSGLVEELITTDPDRPRSGETRNYAITEKGREMWADWRAAQ